MNRTLNLKSVNHSYGKKKILSEVVLSCATGDILSIFGRNGSGKSTLLKILFGTEKADSINLLIDDKIIKPSPKNNLIAYLPQESFMPRDIQVRDIVSMYFPDGETQNKIFNSPLIHKIELQKTGTLSLGEQRYLEFLLIINLSHPFVLLDEPFSMVEPLYRDTIKKVIKSKQSEKGFILTDHYYSDSFEIATKKLIIKEGVSYEVESIKNLIEMGYLPNKESKSTEVS